MIRIVVDTNVVVSGALTDEGLPASVLDLAANGKVLMLVSPDVLAEYAEVLRRPRFKLSPAHVNRVLSVIGKTSEPVKPARRLSISRDEPDNRFYECAEAGKADFLITGNTQHFPLHHRGTRVVTPREFIELIGFGLTAGDPLPDSG
jgi:putative PIN family toxin of toxin-antitoxin system